MNKCVVTIALWMLLAHGDTARAQRPDPGLKAMANGSTDIIVAEVLDTQPTKAEEGARDTVQLKVVRTLKGPLKPGDKIGVYYHLLWVDTEKWILETPKFVKGNRYTVFAINSNGYTLADQWLAVLPEHPELDPDVAYALNDVGDLWHSMWNEPQGALISRRRIDILPQRVVAQTKDGLILSVKIVNHSSEEITTRLAHEWHGGPWPPTDLYALVSHAHAKQPSAFEPVYLKGESAEATKKTRIAPGQAVTVEVRMDWPGTGTAPRAPLMSTFRYEYHVRLLMAFDTRGNVREYATGANTCVRIVPD